MNCAGRRYFIVARGPVPRDLSSDVIFTVARGPVPRDLSSDVIFTVARGPVPRDLYRLNASLGPLGP